MSNVTLTFVSSTYGDWEGIYINEKLETEYHSIPANTWLEIIDSFRTFVSVKRFEIDGDYMNDIANLHFHFYDIPEEYLTEVK